tara:strand:+ start:226 stop:348 length:123 start_codon:yes stop_codon:yes gene_type:complete
MIAYVSVVVYDMRRNAQMYVAWKKKEIVTRTSTAVGILNV